VITTTNLIILCDHGLILYLIDRSYTTCYN